MHYPSYLTFVVVYKSRSPPPHSFLRSAVISDPNIKCQQTVNKTVTAADDDVTGQTNQDKDTQRVNKPDV